MRNGSVIDLQIEPGEVHALVMGSSLYKVAVKIKPLEAGRWQALVGECAGRIGSLVELLQGKLSDGVLGILADRGRGLFPAPREISLDCSCPDAAVMCKHVAAVLYGVGKRLDERPELFFTLRQVDQADLIARATDTTRLGQKASSTSKRLAPSELSSVFGIELDPGPLVQGAGGTPRGCCRGPAGPEDVGAQGDEDRGPICQGYESPCDGTPPCSRASSCKGREGGSKERRQGRESPWQRDRRGRCLGAQGSQGHERGGATRKETHPLVQAAAPIRRRRPFSMLDCGLAVDEPVEQSKRQKIPWFPLILAVLAGAAFAAGILLRGATWPRSPVRDPETAADEDLPAYHSIPPAPSITPPLAEVRIDDQALGQARGAKKLSPLIVEKIRVEVSETLKWSRVLILGKRSIDDVLPWIASQRDKVKKLLADGAASPEVTKVLIEPIDRIEAEVRAYYQKSG